MLAARKIGWQLYKNHIIDLKLHLFKFSSKKSYSTFEQFQKESMTRLNKLYLNKFVVLPLIIHWRNITIYLNDYITLEVTSWRFPNLSGVTTYRAVSRSSITIRIYPLLVWTGLRIWTTPGKWQNMPPASYIEYTYKNFIFFFFSHSCLSFWIYFIYRICSQNTSYVSCFFHIHIHHVHVKKNENLKCFGSH